MLQQQCKHTLLSKRIKYTLIITFIKRCTSINYQVLKYFIISWQCLRCHESNLNKKENFSLSSNIQNILKIWRSHFLNILVHLIPRLHRAKMIQIVPVYTGHSLFNTTKRITLLFIVQSLLHRNPPYIWIKMIQIAIQSEYIHRTKVLDLQSRTWSGQFCSVFDNRV